MIGLALLVALLAIVAGVLVKLLLDRSNADAQITWAEFAVGSLVVVPIVTLAVVAIGWKLAWNNQVTFQEYWNGWELSTQWDKVTCTRDGPCVQEYHCDSYSCNPHECSCDSDGNNCSTCWDTCWHDCPYCKEEWNFYITTSLGQYTIAKGRFPNNPVGWRGPIPSWIVTKAGTGIPEFWQAASNRVNAGKPGPVTKRESYENYILASDASILRQYSNQIAFFKDNGLLPELRRDVVDWYLADKVYFVGYKPTDPSEWQKAHSYLNAALGTELQGDLHLVIAQDPRISSAPDAYITALKAYWSNPEVWGKDSISKNTIIIVLGTDGETVIWARAQTGMPLGNESMIAGIQSFFRDHDVPLKPEEVIGNVAGQFYEKIKEETGEKKIKVRGIGEQGALRRLLWGLDSPQTKFIRISMNADDSEDVGSGFGYLAKEIEPNSGQKRAIVLVAFVFCLVVWVAFAFIGETRDYQWRSKRYYR